MIGQRVHTRVYTYIHIQTNSVLYFLHWAVWLASSQATECQRVKGDHCLAALVSCASAPLWVCVCVCLYVLSTWQHDLFDHVCSPGGFSHIFIHIIILYILYSVLARSPPPCSPLSASIIVPPFLLISQPSITYSLVLSASSPPSLLLAQIDRADSLGLFINPIETHIV